MADVTTFVALLRAVNVGGNNKIAMPALRVTLESLGYSDVTTYIQSGNIVFDSTQRKSAALVPQIEAAISRDFGLAIDVVVRSARELTTAIESNPYVGRITNPLALHVVFLNEAPDRARVNTLDPTRFRPDEFTFGTRELYLHCPDGVGRSKLPSALLTKLAPEPATMRNWNTVTKLAALAAR
jgi:uncharacterized protein (DUF1697 family)